MIDPKQLQGIASDAPDLVLKILTDFTVDAQTRLAQAEQALLEGNLKEAGLAYHQLIGSSATLGLSKLSEELRQLETACKAGLAVVPTTDLEALLLDSVTAAQALLG